ncbi:MAG: purine-binding chemotaxis protein CheW [Gammaproteobacteria bacterium]|nr:MAG: purine-binding chemotaxis protein CheW [Gammaproteobacteria bacterium]
MRDAQAIALRSLKDHPFDLLREIERRSKTALAGATGIDVNVEEWVGIGFRLGDEQFIVARDSIREVLMVPAFITRVPGARAWIKGLANVRGHLLPIVDLKAFLGAGANSGDREARVLVLHGIEMPIGLIVDEVYGFRRFLDTERTTEISRTIIRCERYLEGVYERGIENWLIFSMQRLEASDEFQHAAEPATH